MSSYGTMEQYWIWLSSVSGIGTKRFYRLLGVYEDARTVWDSVGDENMRFLGAAALGALRAARTEQYFYSLFQRLDELGVRAVTRVGEGYPEALETIYDPPPTLFVKGRADLSAERMFSIVGSRRASRDGQRAAREIAEGLALHGVTVVSGMARGIDTCAHEGALNGGGPTIAVLGCGPDVIYPPENERLEARILDSDGAVISEYPPGVPPLAHNFPARNRIISGLSRGTLLVEGAEKSGAMITVTHAMEQGRDVFAVPGGIYSPQSAIPNRLIVEGATPVLSPWEILEPYRWGQREQPVLSEGVPEVELDEEERRVVEPLKIEELSFEELISRTGISPSWLNSHLTILELRGIIVKAPGGLYRAY